MANTNESDAPAADTTPPAATSAPASTPAAARSSRSGLRVAGTVAGSVLAAALLFGGGVAVGLAVPGVDIGPDSASGQADERPSGRDGVRPGSRDGARPGGQDRQRPPIGGDRPLHEHPDTAETGDAEDGSAEN